MSQTTTTFTAEQIADLITAHTKLAHRVAYHYAPTAYLDHDDFLQYALMGLWKACHYYDPAKGVWAGFAARVMHNEIRMALRKVAREPMTCPWDAQEEGYGQDEGGIAHIIQQDAWQQVWQSLLQHTDAFGRAVIRQRAAGHSIRQTAQRLACSPNRVVRVLKILRQTWGEELREVHEA